MNSAILLDQPFGNPRHERADSVRNRVLLLETARRLFDEQGVDCVTMSAVAEAANVGKGTLYRHFPNKTHLMQELLDGDQRELQERTFRYLRAHVTDPAGSLAWFLSEVVRFISRHEALLFGLIREMHVPMLEHPAHQWWRLTIRGLLARAKPALDLDYATDLLYVMLDPSIIYYQKQQHGFSDAALTRHLADVLRRLLASD